MAQIDSPIARFDPTSEELIVINNAIQVESVGCAARFDVDRDPYVYVSLAEAASLSNRYGLFDSAWVAQHGYTPQEPPQSDGAEWNPSHRELEVLTGFDANGDPSTLTDNSGKVIPVDGCFGEAGRAVFPETRADVELQTLVLSGLDYSLGRMANDSRVLGVFDEWASCMDGKGYQISSVEERSQTISDMREKGSSSELKLASADVECSQEVNSPGIQHAVDRAYQERWLTEHGSELKAVHEAYEEGLERAKKILAG